MISTILPAGVAYAHTDVIDVSVATLWPAEFAAVRRAVPARQREFATGRAMARRALGQLGLPAQPIPVGARRQPVWPPGVVGSITHTAGYCAAVAAWGSDDFSLGIDAEVRSDLPTAIVDKVASAPELDSLPSLPRGVAARLIFSAKEAIYKAWFPRTGRWLGFDEADVRFGDDLAFSARLAASGLPDLEGAYGVSLLSPSHVFSVAYLSSKRTSPNRSYPLWSQLRG